MKKETKLLRKTYKIIYKNTTIKSKIIYGTVAIIFITTIIGTILSMNDIKEVAREGLIQHVRAVKAMGEAVLKQTSQNWETGMFDIAAIKKNVDNKDYSIIPIVSTFNAIKQAGENTIFKFRTPVVNPRNQANTAGEEDLKIFEKLKNENLDEYYFVDRKTDQLHYYQTLRMADQCIKCHGDPATSEKLWGNKEGLDFTGKKMEGYKVGDFYGAMVLTYKLDALSPTLVRDLIINNILYFLIYLTGIALIILTLSGMLGKVNK